MEMLPTRLDVTRLGPGGLVRQDQHMVQGKLLQQLLLGGSHDEVAARLEIMDWLKEHPVQPEDKVSVDTPEAPRAENVGSHPALATEISTAAPVSANRLFGLLQGFLEEEVAAEFIVADEHSLRLEGVVYEQYTPIGVAVRVLPRSGGSSSEAIFSNTTRRDVVHFNRIVARAAASIKAATSAYDVPKAAPRSALELLDFDFEEDDEGFEGSEGGWAFALEPLLAQLGSSRSQAREEAMSQLASLVAAEPGCRGPLAAALALPPHLAAFASLLRPEEGAGCLVARYPALATLALLGASEGLPAAAAQALLSVVPRLALEGCSALVVKEHAGVLGSLQSRARV